MHLQYWVQCLWHGQSPGAVSIWRCHLTSIGIPMLLIRGSRDRLIFNIGIPYLERPSLYWYGALVPWWEIHRCFIVHMFLLLRHLFIMNTLRMVAVCDRLIANQGPNVHHTTHVAITCEMVNWILSSYNIIENESGGINITHMWSSF